MSLVSIIICVLVLVAVVAYFKNLSPENRNEQAGIVKDVATISVFATGKIAKTIIKTTYDVAAGAAMDVEASHGEAISKTRSELTSYIKTNGGSAPRAGVKLGETINTAVYLDDAEKAAAKYKAEQKARLATITATMAKAR